jgi:hypothetical protein
MNARSLEEAMRSAGYACTVEAHDRLAIVLPERDTAALESGAARRAMLALARDHGFTHLALELPDEEGEVASVLRD